MFDSVANGQQYTSRAAGRAREISHEPGGVADSAVQGSCKWLGDVV